MPKNGGESQMTPEQLAAVPPTFFDYALVNPGVLPDYSQFAHEAFEAIRQNPDHLVIFTGRRGIGKTMRFIPALLHAAESQDVRSLGSIFSLPMYGKEVTHLDPHEYHIKEWGIEEVDHRFQRPFWRDEEGPADLTKTIQARFESAVSPSLFVMDEAVAAMSGMAIVIQTVLREAEANGVTLAVTQPEPDDLQGAEREAHENAMDRLSYLSKKIVRVMPIEVVPVPNPEVAKMFQTVGIDLALAEKLEARPRLRTLRFVEHLYQEAVFQRIISNAEILGGDYFRNRILLRTDIVDALGLSVADQLEVQTQFSETKQ